MPGQDDMSPPADRTGADREAQQCLSRRSVLRGAVGAGVAGIAATALAGTAMAASAAAVGPTHGTKTETPDADADADASEQIVVHVRDAKSGQIDVFRGTSQTSLRDPDLAARLVRASR